MYQISLVDIKRPTLGSRDGPGEGDGTRVAGFDWCIERLGRKVPYLLLSFEYPAAVNRPVEGVWS